MPDTKIGHRGTPKSLLWPKFCPALPIGSSTLEACSVVPDNIHTAPPIGRARLSYTQSSGHQNSSYIVASKPLKLIHSIPTNLSSSPFLPPPQTCPYSSPPQPQMGSGLKISNKTKAPDGEDAGDEAEASGAVGRVHEPT